MLCSSYLCLPPSRTGERGEYGEVPHEVELTVGELITTAFMLVNRIGCFRCVMPPSTRLRRLERVTRLCSRKVTQAGLRRHPGLRTMAWGASLIG